jgi:hypothetical protein
MGNVESYLSEIDEFLGEVRSLHKKLDLQSGYKMERIVETFNSMFERFCPFRVGDRIELSYTPEITNEKSPGWRGSKHHLIEGAPGTVVSRDFVKDHFRFDVKMDLESWVPSFGDDKGRWSSVSARHTYCMYEGQIRPSTKEEWIIHRTEGAAPKWVGDLIGDVVAGKV